MPRRPSMASLTDVESDNLIPYSVRKLLQLLSERKTPKSRLANIVNQMNVVDSDILDKVPQHQEQFIEDLTIKEYGAFATIFEEGDFPDGYYHILHGSVQIWKATKLSEEEVQKQREEAGDDGGEGEAFYDKRGIHICDLATGCGFGELGFQGDRQAVRSASVVAAERTICLVSSANVYLKLMELSIKSQLRRKIDWLENCALFRHWSDEKRYEFAQSLRSYKCAKGRYVCTSGEPAAGVWFLIGGEIRVQTHLDKEKENEKAPTERRQVELALLGAGDVFGVCEHVEERREMSRSAYATKASSAYFAGTSAVLTLMFEDEVTRQLMIALTKKRRKWEALAQQALSARR
ncbi:cAMP-dependent protein kinase regulator [Aureococcus anophagefferens]|nr:cAMP-dependent protein kinase regulator [Aureococcus anophagefferens]